MSSNQELIELKQLINKMASNIYNVLGSGHSEYIYHRAFEIELRNNSIAYESEKRIIITYKSSDNKIYSLGEERIDIFLVDFNIIIELKAIISFPKETEVNQINKYYRELSKIGIIVPFSIIINFPQAGVKQAKEIIDFIIVDH